MPGRVRSRAASALATIWLFISTPVLAQLPTIDSLELADPLFRQHQDGVRTYFRRASAGGEIPPLLLYAYEPKAGETLFGIAARLTIPYSAIVKAVYLCGFFVQADLYQILE